MEFIQVFPTNYGKVLYGTAGKQSLESLKEKYPLYPKNPERWKDYTEDWVKGEWKVSSPQIITLNQVHGNSIHFIYRESKILNELNVLEGDGLYTESDNSILFVRTADCVPVFLYSHKRPFVAIVHSGWKGTSLGITERLIDETLRLGYDLEELHLEIGPYIQRSDYEVGEDVAEHFLSLGDAVCLPIGHGKFLLDVGLAIEMRVKMRFQNFNRIKNLHTNVCRSPLYFSHRAKEEGRNLNFILWES